MSPPPLTPAEFAVSANVSGETLARLETYAELLVRRQQSLNLVGPATLGDLWRRHMLDSIQLLPHLPEGPILDLGSGAGFPGLVLAIAGSDAGLGPVHLTERLGAKCAFLAEVARATGVESRVHIHKGSVEKLIPFEVAVITARAAAPLPKLLEWCEPFLKINQSYDTVFLFHKGRSAEDELTEAGKAWKMKVERLASVTDPDGRILRLSEVRRGRVQP